MKSFRSVWQKFMLGNEHTGAIPIQQDIHKKSLFYRLFYYSQFYSQLRMSYTTRLLLVSYCLFLSYSILGMESLVLPIALVLLSLIFLADALLGQIFVPKLDLQRKLPDSCVSGASFTVIYTLTNKRKVSAYNLILDHYNYPGLKKVSGVACVCLLYTSPSPRD